MAGPVDGARSGIASVVASAALALTAGCGNSSAAAGGNDAGGPAPDASSGESDATVAVPDASPGQPPPADASSVEDASEFADAAPDAAAPLRIEAWIFPGDPACNAPVEYSDGRHIDVLKPEYYRVDDTGALVQRTVAIDGCNGYSAANAADVKAHSTRQLMTVSADGAQIGALCGDPTKRANAVSTLVTFVGQIGFTGVDIDFEGIQTADYQGYLTFLQELGDALHAKGALLEVDATAYASAADEALDAFRYEDVDPLPVDGITIMAYDYMTDYSPNGAGDPIAPTAWVDAVMDYTFPKLKDPSRLVIGIPSYGYSGKTGSFTVDREPSSQFVALPGATAAKPFSNAFEMTWASQGTSYVYVDAPGLDAKRASIAGKGAAAISVWHLGGNAWFTN
jgi:spore germination protein YaaH